VFWAWWRSDSVLPGRRDELGRACGMEDTITVYLYDYAHLFGYKRLWERHFQLRALGGVDGLVAGGYICTFTVQKTL
jgi:hypothetical protein